MSGENNEIRIPGDLKILKLEPGDVVVLTYKNSLSLRNKEMLREAVRGVFTNGNKMLIVDDGLELSTISKKQLSDLLEDI